MPVPEARVAAVISAYDAQGWHRTGTEVDTASADWLAGEMGRAGGVPHFEAFAVARVEPGESYLEVGGTKVPGIPAFDGGFTGPGGIFGALTVALDTGPVLALHVPVAGAGVELLAAREAPGVGAIVVSVAGAAGRPLRNADRFAHASGPPVLQVGPEWWPRIQAWAAAGLEARVVVQAGRMDCEAQNVISTVRGGKSALRPLVVMTPRSGWWQCASERGGGIVCWLEALRAVAAGAPARDVVFVATSGHELGHLGLEDFIERRLELPAEAACWVHLGANIGAATGARLAIRSSQPDLAARAEALLREEAFGQVVVADPPGPVVGEAANIAAHGGRFVSLIGANELFHTEQDRWPQAVDTRAVAAAAAAVTRLVVELARTGAQP